MARDFAIDGEVLALVKGGQHTSLFISGDISTLKQLGLASEPVRVIPRWIHKDIYTDDFGPDIPAELMTFLADVTITLPLIHFDPLILDTCLDESLGGTNAPFAGTMPPAGSLIGNGLPVLSSGCHYISLNLTSPVLNYPWHFPATVMTGPPLEWPMGTEASVVLTTWRAIPYIPPTSSNSQGQVSEAISSGTVLWNRTLDT